MVKWDVDERVFDFDPSAKCHSNGLSPKRRIVLCFRYPEVLYDGDADGGWVMQSPQSVPCWSFWSAEPWRSCICPPLPLSRPCPAWCRSLWSSLCVRLQHWTQCIKGVLLLKAFTLWVEKGPNFCYHTCSAPQWARRRVGWRFSPGGWRTAVQWHGKELRGRASQWSGTAWPPAPRWNHAERGKGLTVTLLGISSLIQQMTVTEW